MNAAIEEVETVEGGIEIEGEIRDNFRKYGRDFMLMSLSGDYRIYRSEKSTRGRNHIQYEIVKPIMMGGVLRYPPSSMWGTYGWTCLNEKHVVEKITYLLEQDKHKH